MPRPVSVVTSIDLGRQMTAGRMTIGIDLSDRGSHFRALNDQAQVIALGSLPTTATAFRREFAACRPVSLRSKSGPILYGSARCSRCVGMTFWLARLDISPARNLGKIWER